MENRLPQFLFLFPFLFLSTTLAAQLHSNFYFELTPGPPSFEAPLTVNFVNASRTEGETRYSWQIEGREFSTELDPRWTFREAGKYRVCLTLDNREAQHEQCQLIEVFAPRSGVVALDD
ncbi:MAG: PKD domain-containing protein [Bacteroidota bacterium]